MTTTKKTTAKATVAEAMSSLLELQTDRRLPAIESLRITDANGIISLDFESVEDLAAWSDALECDEYSRITHRYADRTPIHNAFTYLLGWHVTMIHAEPEPDAAALMADATQQLRASTDAPSFLAGVNALMDASQAAADAEAGA